MNGIELYVLGRRLMKLGEDAMPRVGLLRLPSSVQTILLDISEHPESSISQIVARTGFPQSLVSEAVARLRDRGALVTKVDPADRRRTLVELAPDVRGRMQRAPAESVEPVVADALGIDDRHELAGVMSALAELGRRFATVAEATENGAKRGARKED